MAPVPQPTSYMPAQTAQLPSSLKWFFLVMLGIFSASLVILALVWVTRKTKKSISAFLQRLEERKLVLPTSLDPWTPRPIVLPLPENFIKMNNLDLTIVRNVESQLCLFNLVLDKIGVQ